MVIWGGGSSVNKMNKKGGATKGRKECFGGPGRVCYFNCDDGFTGMCAGLNSQQGAL